VVGRFCGGCRQVLCILGAFPAICGGFRRICAGLEYFRRSVVLSARLAVGDLGLLVDSVVAVGDLGLSEGSGVAVGDLGCRQVLGWLLEFFLVADCWCYEGSGVADCCVDLGLVAVWVAVWP
jgi:hypothetical protein